MGSAQQLRVVAGAVEARRVGDQLRAGAAERYNRRQDRRRSYLKGVRREETSGRPLEAIVHSTWWWPWFWTCRMGARAARGGSGTASERAARRRREKRGERR